MKQVVFILFLFYSFTSNAQLANTSWSFELSIPNPTPGNISFKSFGATLSIKNPGGGVDDIVEIMGYKIKNDTLYLKKATGLSSCGSEVGAYLFKLEGERLFIEVIDDPCLMRRVAMPKGWIAQVPEIF